MAEDYNMNDLLKSYPGAATSAKNANIARQFFASNPEVATHRAMGMRGSVLDDNSDLLNALLDPVMAQTDSVPPATTQQPQVMPTVQNSTQQTRRTATAGQASPTGTYVDPRRPPLPPVNPLDAPVGQDNWDWLKALLGISAAGGMAATRGGNTPTPEATYVGRMQRAGENDPRARGYFDRSNSNQIEQGRQGGSEAARIGEQRKIENQGPTEVRSSPETEQLSRERAARDAKVADEVNAENEGQRQLQEQIMKRNRDIAATEDLLRAATAAKRVSGRR